MIGEQVARIKIDQLVVKAATKQSTIHTSASTNRRKLVCGLIEPE